MVNPWTTAHLHADVKHSIEAVVFLSRISFEPGNTQHIEREKFTLPELQSAWDSKAGNLSESEMGSIPDRTSLKRCPLSRVLVATATRASSASCAAKVTILKAIESPSSAHCSTVGASEAILDHPASAYAHLHVWAKLWALTSTS